MTRRWRGTAGIDELLAEARRGLRRVTALEAADELERTDAVLVDIRPAAQRAAAGEIPGAVVIERNHLEWRLDPASAARLPWVTGYDVRPVVFCAEGYTSSLAAAALQDLGLACATDVTGGYTAWRAAGRPHTRPSVPSRSRPRPRPPTGLSRFAPGGRDWFTARSAQRERASAPGGGTRGRRARRCARSP